MKTMATFETTDGLPFSIVPDEVADVTALAADDHGNEDRVRITTRAPTYGHAGVFLVKESHAEVMAKLEGASGEENDDETCNGG